MVVTFQPVPIASAPDCVATSMSMEMWPWGGEMTGHYGFVSGLSLSCWVCRVRKSDQIILAWVSLGWLSACKVYIATIVDRRTFNSKIFPDYLHTLKLVNICVISEIRLSITVLPFLYWFPRQPFGEYRQWTLTGASHPLAADCDHVAWNMAAEPAEVAPFRQTGGRTGTTSEISAAQGMWKL